MASGEPYVIGEARLALTRGALSGPQEYVPLTNPHDLHPIFRPEALDAKPARLIRVDCAWAASTFGCKYTKARNH